MSQLTSRLKQQRSLQSRKQKDLYVFSLFIIIERKIILVDEIKYN